MRGTALLLGGLAAVAEAAAAAGAPPDTENMNGEYLVAGKGGAHAPFNTNYSSYPLASTLAKANEYITVTSAPIRSHYGQVFWTMMDAIPLGEEFVKRFDGKV